MGAIKKTEPSVSLSQVKIEVLNGTRINGLAANTAEFLRQKGLNIVEIGNASVRTAKQTIIYYPSGSKDIALKLAHIIPRAQYIQLGKLPADHIRIVLGKNMKGFTGM